MLGEPVVYRAGRSSTGSAAEADPVTTEVIRHGLNSAAEAIKRTLVRTSMSPIIYEVLDFAAAIYDRENRLLAQAPSLPLFMGTLSFCIEAAVDEVGGPEALDPGDIILVNSPYKTGSHPQDAAVVMPVFLSTGELVGYTAIKAHWLDIGAKEIYCTDTIDVYQEGTIFPGVKLYRKGELVTDIMKMVHANSRLARLVTGDLAAQVAGVRIGARELVRLIERYGQETFWNCVERMYDHGETVVRGYIEKLPDGRYVGHGVMDDDGITDDQIPFEVVLEIEGSTARLDFTNAPEARRGPVNCPIATTVSAARVILTMLAGGGEAPNEGHFRPIEVVTRPGSMFHVLPPSPCFLYGWPAMQATEAVLQAVSEAAPEAVCACSGGDLCAALWYGTREATGEFWGDGSPHPVGQGASIHGDGQSSRLHHIEAATRFSPLEVWEAKNPWMMDRCELATDSGGPGRNRGGLGPDMAFRFLEDTYTISTIERVKNAPWGLAGGLPARPNGGHIRFPDGTERLIGKGTGVFLPKGTVFTFHCGGGGGYGPPSEREKDRVLADVREGYVSEEKAREHYPHAFE
ncbi:MAG: hydantoinase B/oxoprolinase family protein [Actinobacteria bacterium]|nr:hydantoinase B/oxoprolinase family protein [Actinomycetota bacterium]